MMSTTSSQSKEHKQKHNKLRRKLKPKTNATADVPTENSELSRIKQLAKMYITNMQFNKRPSTEPPLKDRIPKRTNPSAKRKGHRRRRKRNLNL